MYVGGGGGGRIDRTAARTGVVYYQNHRGAGRGLTVTEQARDEEDHRMVWSRGGYDEDTTERFSCGLYRVVTGRVSDSRVQFFIS